MSQPKKGATTTDLKVAVKEVGYKKPKAISRAMAIARDKLVKEGMMPANKAKKTKKAKAAPVKLELNEEILNELVRIRTAVETLAAVRRVVVSTVYYVTFPFHSPKKLALGAYGYIAWPFRKSWALLKGVGARIQSARAKLRAKAAEKKADVKPAEGEAVPNPA